MGGGDSALAVANLPVTVMTPTRNHADSVPGDELPEHLYIGFVDSLLIDSKAVFFCESRRSR